MTRIRGIHWGLALAVAAGLHLTLFLRFYNEEEATAIDPGQQAISIALAPEPAPEPEEQPAPEHEPRPEPEPQPKPEPEPEPQPEPDPAPKPEPESTPSPVPEPEPQTTPPPSKPAPPEPAQEPAKATPKKQQGTTGGLADAPPDYRARLSAWLERHKRYPRRARRLGQQGTAVLHFVINRQGDVLEWEIREASGHRLLDSAVEEMIRRADPLPAMPDDMKVERLALTVPVNFQLR